MLVLTFIYGLYIQLEVVKSSTCNHQQVDGTERAHSFPDKTNEGVAKVNELYRISQDDNEVMWYILHVLIM